MRDLPAYLVVSGLMLLPVSPAAAQSLDPARLLACAGEVADAARLACYDGLVRGLSAEGRAIADRRDAEAKTAAAAAAAAAAKAAAEAQVAAEAARRAAFGREDLADAPPAADERLGTLVDTVTETFLDRRDMTIFMLSSGQMWRQVSDQPLPPVRNGSTISLKRGALGGYRLSIEKLGRTVSVVRLK